MSVSRNVATITRCCPTPTAFSLLRVRNWFLTDRSSSKPVTSSGIDGSGNLGLFGVSIDPPRWPSRSVPPRGPPSAPRSLPREPPAEEARSSRCGRPPPEPLPEPSRRSPPEPGPRRSPPRSGRPDEEPRRGSSCRGRRSGWSSDTGPGSIRCECRCQCCVQSFVSSPTRQSYGKRKRAPTGLFPVGALSRCMSGGVLLSHTVTSAVPVSYTHLRAHETVLDLVCRLLLEKKK